jgi:membrane protease subunit HflC
LKAEDDAMVQRRGRDGLVATLVLVVLVVVLLLAWMVFFQVEFTEHVLVQTFGKTTRVLDGTIDAGLHVKWPFVQQVVRYDARTFVFEDTMNELQTNDKQVVTLTTFCAWRVQDPVRFQTQIKTIDAGQNGIRTKLRSAKSAVIGERRMEELVNTDPQRMRIAEIEQAMLDEIADEARADYGVEIVRVGIKSLGLPEVVSAEVIKSMQEERRGEAAAYDTAGKAQALAIRERARQASEQILAFAQRKASEIRAQGDEAAAEWWKEFEEDWQFAAFLRSRDSLRKELQNRTIFLLDGSRVPGMGWFRNGASLPTLAPGAGSKALANPTAPKTPATQPGAAAPK